MRRIRNFLLLDEIDQTQVEHEENEENAVILENASFTWDSSNEYENRYSAIKSNSIKTSK